MVDEADVSQERKWLHEERAKGVISNLQKRNMEAQYVSNVWEALSAILELIPPAAVVARGDSVSIEQLGILPEIIKRNQNRLIDPIARDADGHFIATAEERERMQREAFFADIFLTGTNAITLDGKLVSTDAMGNRVAAMIYGPRKVIIVAGVNKIVKDVDEALERIRQIAAPMNAKRHFLKHDRPQFGDLPCARTGSCTDCNHDWRICRSTVILEGNMVREKGRLNVVLVGEELGL